MGDITPSDRDEGHIDSLPALEAMASARSVRNFTSEPVPEAALRQLIWAATRASSPNNVQPWSFVVVTEASMKQKIAVQVQKAYPAKAESQLPKDPVERRNAASAARLISHFADVPALVFVCMIPYPRVNPNVEFMHSAVYSASQNMLVAARSIGLGAAFTTLHKGSEDSIREILGLPHDVEIAITMPVGWPVKLPGPVVRNPIAEVMRMNHWNGQVQ
ncbi:nitroreductase family protein [Rhodococcus ruber]|uniref:Nitroreductase family protein n=1 Tax=Rhodococcus ruber TaxID=1830 RepID=A0ABT4MER8_9NOCA|nr:nitroreductase family protein [Rhodococcus ruber]MCZ4519462.1 nitroreductase family protein [Rhodococcus ruber]